MRVLVALFLVLTLIAPGPAGGLAPYIIDVGAISIVIAVALRRQFLASFRPTAPRLILFAVLALWLCFAISARQPHDLIYAVNFVPLLFLGPLMSALGSQAHERNALRMSAMALIGAAIICGLGAFNAIVLGFDRGSGGNFPPITLSNTAVLLGYISVAGLWSTKAPWRWIFLSGPLFGIGIALITGSRGPLIGVVPLSILAAIFIVREAKVSRIWVGSVALVAIVVAAIAGTLFSARISALVGVFQDLTGGGTVADTTTAIRLTLYRAGWMAFLESPIWGHGWANIMTAIVPYLPPDDAWYAKLPQLHNDVVDFLVTAGIIGVIAYLTILAAPLVGAMRSVRDSQYATRLYGGLVLLLGYASAGLTDIMIGFEFHTTYFAALAAIVLGYCRDPARA